jgi:drug/metabolite transporter (DMT)-like permease
VPGIKPSKMIALAFVLVIISAFLHALWNFTTKKVSGNLSVLYIALVFASIFLLPFAFVFIIADGIMPSSFLYILATGIVHALYFFFLSKTYTYGNISVVYPVARGCGVIGTALIAVLTLHESLSIVGIAGIICTSLGVLVIGSKKGDYIGYRKGLLYALLVGVTMIFYSIIDKVAMASIDPVIYIQGLFLLSMFFLTPYMFIARGGELHDAWRKHRKYSLVIGAGSAVGYLIILYVFRMAQVSYVVAVRELSVAIGAMLGMTYLGEARSQRKLAGIALIVAGLIMIKIA